MEKQRLEDEKKEKDNEEGGEMDSKKEEADGEEEKGNRKMRYNEISRVNERKRRKR